MHAGTAYLGSCPVRTAKGQDRCGFGHASSAGENLATSDPLMSCQILTSGCVLQPPCCLVCQIRRHLLRRESFEPPCAMDEPA